MSQMCILPKLKETIESEQQKKLKQGFVLRFTFTDKTNRITNIEQLSIHRDQQPFPRNVRRLIKNRNTIYFYFQSTDEYIEEWKKRYCLSSLQQQKYFFSFILCIAAVMKYIECEFQHQMISFPYKKYHDNQKGVFSALDDSDVQRHKRDFELWNGFFIPPEHQFQTSQISQDDALDAKNKRYSRHKHEKKINVKKWYKSLGIVEPFKKFIYEASSKHKKRDKLFGLDKKKIFCEHDANERDILWLSTSTQDVYCNRCGVLLQFSECIRKYVLETENREVIDFLWPWYRNYFHRRDMKKYHTYVAKYNLSHLFKIEDVLDKDRQHPQSENTCNDNFCFCCNTDSIHDDHDNDHKNININQRRKHNLSGDESDASDDEIDDENKNNKNKKMHHKHNNKGRTQIRHLRKFAAHVLLGGWDILRNLNVIRNQLQCIFGYFDQEKNSFNDEFKSERDEAQEWKTWRRVISKCNQDLKNDLNNSTARKLMELHHEDQLSMSPDEQGIFSNLIGTILTHANIYNPQNDSVIDGFNNESFSDLKLDNSDDAISTISQASSMGARDNDHSYYYAFKQSWKRVPDWWFSQHDKLLLELALKYNWDKNLYKLELTHPSKKQYYQVLLTKKNNLDDEDVRELSEYSQSLEDDDDDPNNDGITPKSGLKYINDTDESDEDEEDDYVGYQEFQYVDDIICSPLL